MIRTHSLATLLVIIAAQPALAQTKIEYNRDIRPILAENCFACHGPDSASRKAGLRLDQRDAAIEAEAIAPGHPDKSALIERIFAEEPSQRMPPAKTNKKLTAAQKETLKRWIASGAARPESVASDAGWAPDRVRRRARDADKSGLRNCRL